MFFLRPWWLLGLLAVAAAAWVSFRPARRVVVVGSTALWRDALASLDSSRRRKAHRVDASWLLLLAGAVAGVLSAAGPVVHYAAPARRVAIAVGASAELGGPGGAEELHQAVGALIDRLDGRDRVQLLLPLLLGGPSGWLAPADARRRTRSVLPLPVAADELVLPPPSPQAQHVYRFVPSGTSQESGPNVSIIELPCALPPVTLDDVGAAETSGGGAGVFAALKNNTASAQEAGIAVTGYDRNVSVVGSYSGQSRTIDAHGRAGFVAQAEPAEILVVSVTAPGGDSENGPYRAYLVRRPVIVRKVAMTGRDDPLLRRFVKVDPTLELIGEPRDADVVIANGVDAPADKPALVIDPPSPPAGWRRGDPAGPIVLADADKSADDPLVKDVALEAVAVRRVSPWIAGDQPTHKRLVSYKGGVLILRSRDRPGPGAPAARRIYVAFDLGTDNTNIAMTESLVIFLGGAMRWLSPGGRGRTTFDYVTPVRAGVNPDFSAVLGKIRPNGATALPGPGVYRDASGAFHAVSLPGLRAALPKTAPREAVAALALPSPRRLDSAVELWRVLAAAATVLWLLGWTLRATAGSPRV